MVFISFIILAVITGLVLCLIDSERDKKDLLKQRDNLYKEKSVAGVSHDNQVNHLAAIIKSQHEHIERLEAAALAFK